MSDTSANNKRIAKNTLLLYVRMLFIMAVSLYTSRVILSTLGVEDYGIYNVVGGVVAMFGFLNGSMSDATQRFITFAIGKGNQNKLKTVFSTTLQIHILIAIIIVILSETIGLWFLYNKLQIPTDRTDAAFWVLQCSIFSSVVMVLSVPYNAAIIAHEKMSAFEYISILEVVLRLVIVYLLLLFSFDKLVLYAILALAIQILIRFCYSIYCNRHFSETKYAHVWDKKLFKEILSFAGWSLGGNFAFVLFTQGINILLNMFFGPVVNAARAISVQVQCAIAQFATNIQMAFSPQITKTFAADDLKSMHILIFRSSKFTYMLLLLIALPVCVEVETILQIWLKNVPENTAIFVQFLIVCMIIDSSAKPLMTAASATGNVRRYQTVLSLIYISIVPLSYIALKVGCEAWSVFLINALICGVTFIVRLYLVRPLINLSIKKYYQLVFAPCSMVTLISVTAAIGLHLLLPNSMPGVVSVILLTIIVVAISSYTIGLDKHERSIVNSKFKSILHRKVGLI